MLSPVRRYVDTLAQAPLAIGAQAALFLGVIVLPMGHLLGVIMLLLAAGLSLPATQWRLGGLAMSLCLPLAVAYGLVVGAELLSANDLATTAETAFNYLPLLLVPVIFAGCRHNGTDIQQLIRAVIVSAVLMAVMALVEVLLIGQPYANGSPFEAIAIAPREFALVAFLYGLMIASALLINRTRFVNPIHWRWIVLGLAACVLCMLLSGTRTMLVPTLVVTIVGLFAIAFNSSRRWIAPSLLVALVLGAIALSGLPAVQAFYDGLFEAVHQTISVPRSGLHAERLSKWLAGWELAQQSPLFGHGNIHATRLALEQYLAPGWPPFGPGFTFDSAYIDHFALFGALGLAGLLIVLMAPMVVVGPTWFRLYAAIVVLGTALFAGIGRFLNNDITGSAMLVMWLSLLLTQALVGKRQS